MILVQMRQNEQVDGGDPVPVQKLQQRPPAFVVFAAAVHHHGPGALRRIQQQHSAVGPAHIQDVQLTHRVSTTSSPT